MISSKFILNILDLLLGGDEVGKALRSQVPYLTDTDYEYTGSGLFVTFEAATGIENLRYNQDKLVLDGVSIVSPELDIGAYAIAFISNGIIDFLEICSNNAIYPGKELNIYTIKQRPAQTVHPVLV